MYQPGEKVEVRAIPWKGIIGTYVEPVTGMFGRVKGHRVQVGDLVSGGTPRIVRVHKSGLRKLPSVGYMMVRT